KFSRSLTPPPWGDEPRPITVAQPLSPENPGWRSRSAQGPGLTCQVTGPAIQLCGGGERSSIRRRRCSRAPDRNALRPGAQGARATGRVGRPATGPTPGPRSPTIRAVPLSSWTQVSNRGLCSVRLGQLADHLDPDQGARRQLGDPGRPRNTIL